MTALLPRPTTTPRSVLGILSCSPVGFFPPSFSPNRDGEPTTRWVNGAVPGSMSMQRAYAIKRQSALAEPITTLVPTMVMIYITIIVFPRTRSKPFSSLFFFPRYDADRNKLFLFFFYIPMMNEILMALFHQPSRTRPLPLRASFRVTRVEISLQSTRCCGFTWVPGRGWVHLRRRRGSR